MQVWCSPALRQCDAHQLAPFGYAEPSPCTVPSLNQPADGARAPCVLAGMARAACSRTETMRPSVRPERRAASRLLPLLLTAAPPLPLQPLRFFAAISSQSCRCTATAHERRCRSTGDIARFPTRQLSLPLVPPYPMLRRLATPTTAPPSQLPRSAPTAAPPPSAAAAMPFASALQVSLPAVRRPWLEHLCPGAALRRCAARRCNTALRHNSGAATATATSLPAATRLPQHRQCHTDGAAPLASLSSARPGHLHILHSD